MSKSTLERFEEKFEPVTESGCWIWMGYCTPKGYGRFQVNGKPERAHRMAYRLYSGPIHEGLYVCHKCDNPSCVNPSHLFLGTNSDNMRDCVEKGRHGGALGGSKRTHCMRGHEFTPENTYVGHNGGRECRTCLRKKWRERYRAKKISQKAS